MHREAEAEAALEAEEAQGVASVARREGRVASAVEVEARLGAGVEDINLIGLRIRVILVDWRRHDERVP